jgi:hypothetical protein
MVKNSTSLPFILMAVALMTTTGYSQTTDGYYVSEVISYQKGFVKASDDPSRFNPERALGAPSDDVDKFVALGFGGELVVKFPAPVKNGEGADIRVHETSWGNPPCDAWPEKASISVSKNNIDWISLGTICHTGELSFPDDLDWILYVKIKDVSDPDGPWYGTNIDGYDINAIVSLHGWLGPVIPTLECINNNNNGSYTAFLGYDNQDKLTFSIPTGVRNSFSTTTDLGQPVEFLPGLHAKDFFIEFDGNTIVWTLVGPDSVARTVQFSSSSPACSLHFPTAKISGNAILCGNEDAAEVTVELTGTGPWTIVYENSAKQQTTVSGISASPYTFSSKENTTFTLVSVSDVVGSGAVTGSATINVFEKPSANISGGGIICEEDGAVLVTIQLSGVAPFTVVYSDGTQQHTLSNVNENTISLETKKSGEYTLVSVSDAHCTGSIMGMAVVSNLWIPVNLSADSQVCYGQEINLSSGLTETNNLFSWTASGNGAFKNAKSLNPTYVPANGETGETTFTFTIENTCGTVVKSIKVDIMNPVDPDFTFPEKIETHVPVAFTPVQSDADKYFWKITGENSSEQKVLQHTFTEAGEYEVSLLVTKDGCENEMVKIISVGDTRKNLYIPNVFSPWATNPENQVVKVYGAGISTEEFHFRILNRWGNILFETTNLSFAQNTGWDGKARGTGEMQALGVYTFMLKGKFLDGEKIERTGAITMVK